MRTITITRRSLGLVVASSVVLSLAAGPPVMAAELPSFTRTVAEAQAGITDAVATGAVDSISVSITSTDALVWAGAGGDQDTGKAASTATTYGIGSVSKVITTVAVMQLVDKGKIGLDQPVVKYLPAFTMKSPQHRQITVRMLLNHSAGFPGSTYTDGFLNEPWEDHARLTLATLAKSKLKTTPGAISVYCNDCFTVAGEVVAAVSGTSYPTYVERNIFAPLGMTQSTFASESKGVPSTMARTFGSSGVNPQEYTAIYATGGVISTPTDMARLARVFLGRGSTDGVNLLSTQSIAEMGRSQVATTLMPVRSPYMQYGLGWDSVSVPTFAAEGVSTWQKNGATMDYHANLFVAAEAGLAVFVNAAGSQQGIDGAVAALSQRILQSALNEAEVVAEPAAADGVQPSPSMPSVDEINAIEGIYLGTSGGSHRLTYAGGNTMNIAGFVDGAWVTSDSLTYRADGAWWPTGPGSSFYRASTGWGRTYLVVGVQLGRGHLAEFPLAERVAATVPTNVAWAARMGTWLNVNWRPSSTGWSRSPAAVLGAYPGLTGYLDFDGMPIDAATGVGTMFLQVPMNNGRDQNDVLVTNAGFMHVGADVFREKSSVAALVAGSNTVRIGTHGYAEWRVIPAKATLSIRAASEWKLYDADLLPIASGRGATPGLVAPEGALLVVFGKPGQTLTITR